MSGRKVLLLGGVALLTLAFGCSLLPKENVPEGDGWYIKLRIQAPASSKGITVSEFEVTGLNIQVRDPAGEVLKSIAWAPGDASTYLVAVKQLGQHQIEVTHYGERNGEQVQASENALFNIRAMKITMIDIVPGCIGMINITSNEASEPVVYAGGTSMNSSGVLVAGYWKNGTWIGLTPLDATKNCKCHTLFVSGSDVYAGGENRNSLSVIVPGYWKNGAWIDLTPPPYPTGDCYVYSIFVSGSDVYVGGDTRNAPPGYWKNGTWIGLPGGWWWISAIVVSGTDVYVGGSTNSSGVGVPGKWVPGYWKNGTWIGLTTLDATKDSFVWPFFVSGSDVYAGGQNRNSLGVSVPGYWKNGTWIDLTPLDASREAWIWSLFVSGGDVYASGENYSSFGISVPGYWKNGTWIGLTPLDATKDADSGSLFVSRGDVYAGGGCTNSSGIRVPGYWKNGVWTGLAPLDTTKSAGVVTLVVVE